MPVFDVHDGILSDFSCAQPILMTNRLSFKLLGKPQISLQGQAVTGFISSKAQALLVYLAVTGRPHSRESLAGLLWGDMSEAQASKNLRNVLSNLRSLVGAHLLITREEAALNRQSDYWLDVAEFTSTLSDDLTQKDLAMLHNAVELYQGDFLEGFFVSEALAFEEWVAGRRSLLQGLMVQALHLLVVKHLEREEYAAGIDYANRLLAIEPWREETHRHLMILLARSGQRSAALAQYQLCRTALLDELGVEPLPETTALYTRIRSAAAPPPHNLPPQPTPFVGRTAELAEIARFFNKPQAQLLTLVGIGGIGKTRLALQAAARFVDPNRSVEQPFSDGVYITPLAGLGPSEPPGGQLPLVTAIAEALHFTFQGPVPQQAQLLSHLREKRMLLILDNFEYLASEAGQLANILRLAPGVKLLVTSRVRLNLQEEWLMEINGLPIPPTLAEPFDTAMTYGAVQLFVQQAQRVQVGFALTADDITSVIHICQLVEGVPLGIEIAASWVRVLACREIAAEIEHSLDFLTTSLQNVPERHRSLRAVFDYSWNLLTPAEQKMFRQLAVFRRGFRREAAAHIVGASLPILAELVDKSLLHRAAAGRYEIHDLLRLYVEEKLRANAAEYEQVNNAHCRYYAELLVAHQDELKGEDLPRALSVLGQERENVRAAWNWAVSQRRAEEVDMFMACL
jgi:DNA-binding SARP family transcriptional activator/predicted ATPase